MIQTLYTGRKRKVKKKSHTTERLLLALADHPFRQPCSRMDRWAEITV